jgi:hypothetical protein
MNSALQKLFSNTGHTTRFLAVRETLLLVSSYLAYTLCKNQVDSTPVLAALGNAWDLVHVERSLGIAHEATLQTWAGAYSMGFLTFLGYFYAIGLWVALLGSAVIFFAYYRMLYWSLRNVYMITMLVAVVIFAVYPLAPPRMLPGYGMADIAGMYGLIPKEGSRSVLGFNEFAAMPSLHIAWSTLIMLAWWKIRFKWGKTLGITFLLFMTVAVVATANHYILDVFGGALLFAFALWVVGLPRGIRRLVNDYDLQEMMPSWPHPFLGGGLRAGYHRNTEPLHAPVAHGSSLADSAWRMIQ